MAGAQQIELAALERVFQLGDSEVHALRAVELSIAAGEYVAVMGPSGSGKSTLLNILGLLDRPNAGSYRLEGRDVTTLAPQEQARVRSQRIGFVFQSFELMPRMNAVKNVELPLIYADDGWFARHKRARAALERVGLADRMHHRPNQLSGGQKQRVAIARALVTNPDLVLADEPTANLDRDTAMTIIHLMKAIRDKLRTTFVFSTHDARIINEVESVYRLEDGILKPGDGGI